MNHYVADTHALFWYLINSSELGSNARLAFDEADAGQALIYLPAIVVAELYYLNERKGRTLDFAAKYDRLVKSKQFVLLSFYPNHVLDFDSCSVIKEMHDRIIVGLRLVPGLRFCDSLFFYCSSSVLLFILFLPESRCYAIIQTLLRFLL